MPTDPLPEATLAFRLDPYRYISRRARLLNTDVFATRILLRPTICMTGAEAAEVFYDRERFTRVGAAPGLAVKTLFGPGGIQTTDGQQHLDRKRMLMTVLSPASFKGLLERSAAQWTAAIDRWAAQKQVCLYDDLHEMLTRAVCGWAGVPLPEREVCLRTLQLTAMFDAAGAAGPRHLYSRLQRIRGDRWARSLVARVRGNAVSPPEGSALAAVAAYRDAAGRLLDEKTAGVELLNVLRPVVAVSVYIVFVAMALHEHPQTRPRLVSADPDGYAMRFVQEVRRYFPFFPVVAAVVRNDFAWRGYRFPRGRRAMLDLYGTNHDPAVWTHPQRFDPDRYLVTPMTPYNHIPQGGGHAASNHRCPGEDLTTWLMLQAADMLTRRMTYRIPPQNLALNMRRLPALPRSRMVLSEVMPV